MKQCVHLPLLMDTSQAAWWERIVVSGRALGEQGLVISRVASWAPGAQCLHSWSGAVVGWGRPWGRPPLGRVFGFQGLPKMCANS